MTDKALPATIASDSKKNASLEKSLSPPNDEQVTGSEKYPYTASFPTQHSDSPETSYPAPPLLQSSTSAAEPTPPITYPEGGRKAWLVVLGSWTGMVGSLGLLNSIAPLQTYLSTHQLRHLSPATVSWIFSLQVFVVFFCGLQIGPVFDAYGPRWLVGLGSLGLVATLLLLGECTAFWQFVLDYAILGGLSISLMLTPCLACIGHFFDRRRAFATGLAMTGPSLGGIVYPLVFRAVAPRMGFAWATRILGLVMLGLFGVANALLRSRKELHTSRARVRVGDGRQVRGFGERLRSMAMLPDFRIFARNRYALALCTAGLFLMELALFIPLAYLTSYSLSQGLDEEFADNVIAILNAASVFGRAAPGLLADKAGRYNTMASFLALCGVVVMGVWLPASLLVDPTVATAKGLVVTFAVLFGFASGSNLGLIGPVLGQLCATEEYGRFFATSYTVVSFSTLVGIPIAGNLVEAADGMYWGLIVFTGVAYVGAAVCIAGVRVRRVGWKPKEVF